MRQVDPDADSAIFGAALFVLLVLALLARQLIAEGQLCGKSGDGPVTCIYWEVSLIEAERKAE